MITFKERVATAIHSDNTITEGKFVNQTYLLFLGLSKSDLRKLERKGLATRGYSKNFWYAGEKLPNGKKVKEGERFHGKGHRVVWQLSSQIVGGSDGRTSS